MNDPIADMLTRIRNAHLAKKDTVTIPYSILKASIANLLLESNYIGKVEIKEKGKNKQELFITLKYIHNGSAINEIKRISKPGRRVYTKADKIKFPLSGHGIVILSTSQGVMLGKKAKKLNLGGEIICQVW